MKTIKLNLYESYLILGLLFVTVYYLPGNKDFKTNCDVDNPSSMEVVDLGVYQFTAGGIRKYFKPPKLPKLPNNPSKPPQIPITPHVTLPEPIPVPIPVTPPVPIPVTPPDPIPVTPPDPIPVTPPVTPPLTSPKPDSSQLTEPIPYPYSGDFWPGIKPHPSQQDDHQEPSQSSQRVGAEEKQEHVAPPPPEPVLPDGYDRYSKKFNTDQTGWFIYLLKNKDNGHIYIQLFNETRVKTDPKDCYGGEILSYSSQHVENLFNYLNGPNGVPADVSFSVDLSEKDPKITIKNGNGVEWTCDISSDPSKKYVTF